MNHECLFKVDPKRKSEEIILVGNLDFDLHGLGVSAQSSLYLSRISLCAVLQNYMSCPTRLRSDFKPYPRFLTSKKRQMVKWL